MTRILIVPGLFGSGEGHWQRYWLQDHPDVRLVEQDDWDFPSIGSWMDKLKSRWKRRAKPISSRTASAAC